MESEPLLVIATGSSASIVLSSYLTELRAEVGREITVLMTTSAERFVNPEVVGWFSDNVLTCDTPGLNPVKLALTASAVVVLPASANTLSAAALGLAATPAQTALLAAPSPVLYFPHMNPVMWNKPVIRRHVSELRAHGDTVVAPLATTTYHMWKGAKDVGLSLPDPEDAAAIVRDWLLDGAPAVPNEPAACVTCATCGR
ncbi:MAG: flavoprotein [Acidimicrobiales bacterium]|nr:flavoprotein [Acidimicrobiales bacterium]